MLSCVFTGNGILCSKKLKRNFYFERNLIDIVSVRRQALQMYSSSCLSGHQKKRMQNIPQIILARKAPGGDSVPAGLVLLQLNSIWLLSQLECCCPEIFILIFFSEN